MGGGAASLRAMWMGEGEGRQRSQGGGGSRVRRPGRRQRTCVCGEGRWVGGGWGRLLVWLQSMRRPEASRGGAAARRPTEAAWAARAALSWARSRQPQGQPQGRRSLVTRGRHPHVVEERRPVGLALRHAGDAVGDLGVEEARLVGLAAEGAAHRCHLARRRRGEPHVVRHDAAADGRALSVGDGVAALVLVARAADAHAVGRRVAGHLLVRARVARVEARVRVRLVPVCAAVAAVLTRHRRERATGVDDQVELLLGRPGAHVRGEVAQRVQVALHLSAGDERAASPLLVGHHSTATSTAGVGVKKAQLRHAGAQVILAAESWLRARVVLPHRAAAALSPLARKGSTPYAVFATAESERRGGCDSDEGRRTLGRALPADYLRTH